MVGGRGGWSATPGDAGKACATDGSVDSKDGWSEEGGEEEEGEGGEAETGGKTAEEEEPGQDEGEGKDEDGAGGPGLEVPFEVGLEVNPGKETEREEDSAGGEPESVSSRGGSRGGGRLHPGQGGPGAWRVNWWVGSGGCGIGGEERTGLFIPHFRGRRCHENFIRSSESVPENAA